MRHGWWVLAGLLLLGWSAPLRAQVRDNSAILGVNSQDLPFKPINPSLVGVPSPPPDQFSFRRYLAKIIPGLSPTPGTFALPTFPIGGGSSTASAACNMKVLPPLSGPLQPLPPTYTFPKPPASPFQPLPPTTSLPAPSNSLLKPLPPIVPGR